MNHDSDSYGDGEIVTFHLKTGSGGWVGYQMQLNTAVHPPCKGFKYDSSLSADTHYQYYFTCQHVNGRDPDSGYYDLCLDSNCDEEPCTP